METMEFVLADHEIAEYNVHGYKWEKNRNNDLEGNSISGDRHTFTWQYHGSQLTILQEIPESSRKFKLRKPLTMNRDDFMEK
jgi:hypothetical protein